MQELRLSYTRHEDDKFTVSIFDGNDNLLGKVRTWSDSQKLAEKLDIVPSKFWIATGWPTGVDSDHVQKRVYIQDRQVFAKY